MDYSRKITPTTSIVNRLLTTRWSASLHRGGDRRKKLSLLFVCILPCAAAFGGTYTAASCDYSDVNEIINGPTHTAVNGDIIQIPAGTCIWTSELIVPSSIGITIQGAGAPNSTVSQFGAAAPSTIIQDGISASGTPLFAFRPTQGNALTRLSMIEIAPAYAAAPYTPVTFYGTCNSSGCANVRLDNITFPSTWGAQSSSFQDASAVVTDNVYGVFDHNSLTGSDSTQYIMLVNVNHSSWLGVGSYGDKSWASADSLGASAALFIENNALSTNVGLTDCDVSGGCRLVARFNHITDVTPVGGAANHGTETTGRPRGGRQFEIYYNTISCSNTSQGCSSVFSERSGVGVSLSNSFTANTGSWFNQYVYLQAYRTFAGFTPWGYCNGLGPYDTNDGTTYYTGTISSATNSGGTLVVTVSGSPGWTTNRWVQSGSPYSVVDTTVSGSPGYEISSSGTNTLSAGNYGQDYWNGPPAFHSGDTVKILRATVCIDQPARSGGTLLSGSTPTPTGSLGQTLDPVYEAGDTGSAPNDATVDSDSAKLIANRDWYAEVSRSAQTSATSPFNGTKGTGFGTLANRPTTCTTGVGYWATDQGTWNSGSSGGILYKCTATNTWTTGYTPYTYPHPLI